MRLLFRFLAFVLAFGLGGGFSWWVVERTLVLMDPPRSSMTLDMIEVLRDFQADSFGDEILRRIAFVGDSMLVGPPGTVSLPERVRSIANRRAREAAHVSIHTLSWPAWGAVGEYCMADEVIRTLPHLVVLELNLRTVQSGSLGPFSFPELAGWIRPSRLVEAALLPLSDAGITLNRLLLYRLLIGSPLQDAWVGLLDRQARLMNTRAIVEDWVEQKTGAATVAVRVQSGASSVYRRLLVPGRLRAQRTQTEAMLGTVLGGLDAHNGRLVVLDALIRTFRRVDIPVLVWVSPVNVQYMRSLGFSMAGLDESVEAVRTVVEQAGARFLDLHAVLTDSSFRDSGDHYTFDGDLDGTAIVAARLAPAIRRPVPAPPARANAPASSAPHAFQ